MKLTRLTFIIMELNAALDTAKYDQVTVVEVSKQIENANVIPWLRANVPDMDLSTVDGPSADVYHERLAGIHGGYAGQERRKWGVENRGLCLLIAWTNEIVQKQVTGLDLDPV